MSSFSGPAWTMCSKMPVGFTLGTLFVECRAVLSSVVELRGMSLLTAVAALIVWLRFIWFIDP